MDGKEIRSVIDMENVKGLLLINGGGAVALLAFLPAILDKTGYEPLIRAILWGLLLFPLGLITALIHNHLRRRCSLAYDSHKPTIKLLILGEEPCVCHFSHIFMLLSYLCFIIAVILVFNGGFKTTKIVKQQAVVQNFQATKSIKINDVLPAKEIKGTN